MRTVVGIRFAVHPIEINVFLSGRIECYWLVSILLNFCKTTITSLEFPNSAIVIKMKRALTIITVDSLKRLMDKWNWSSLLYAHLIRLVNIWNHNDDVDEVKCLNFFLNTPSYLLVASFRLFLVDSLTPIPDWLDWAHFGNSFDITLGEKLIFETFNQFLNNKDLG